MMKRFVTIPVFFQEEGKSQGLTRMNDDHEYCPYCETQVTCVAEPKPLGHAFYWRKKKILFRSFFSTYRYAFWCQECHLIMFDSRNPEKIQTISPNETGPWKHFFPLEKRI